MDPNGHPPPHNRNRGGEALLSVENASDRNGSPYGFNCRVSRGLSEASYADAVRRVDLLTLAFALCFPAFERLRSTRSLA